MKKYLFTVCVIFISICSVSILGQEVQVPMDSDGKVAFVDSLMNNKIQVFRNYSGFIDARLFQLDDSNYSLEIYYKIDEKFNRHKLKMNQFDVDTLRRSITQKLNNNISNAINQDGRSELLWGLTIAGLACYGSAAIYIAGIEGTSAGGLYMLTSAASFLIPYALTSNSPVSEGAARLSLWGAYSGMAHGLLLYQVFDLDRNIDEYYPDYPNDYYSHTQSNTTALWSLMALTSITEAYIGYLIAQNNDISVGKSDVLVNSSIVCTGAIPGFLYIAGVENKQALNASAIIGTFSGYVLGNYISNTQNYSRGDAMCLSNSWVLGAAVPVSVLLASESNDPTLYISTAIIGAGLGMALGNHLVKGRDFTTSQGVYLSLGAFGGAFVSGGLALLSIGNNLNSGKIIPLFITIGAIGGFALTYSVMQDDPKIQEKNLSGNLQFNINPMALATSFTKIIEYNGRIYSNPILSISYKF